MAERLIGEAVLSGRWPGLAGIVPDRFEWVGVNERRVDARVRSVDGGEWHVVLFVDDADEVVVADAFRRPDAVVAGKGVLVVVNGPSGAGKSSLVTALAAAAEDRPWVVFDEPILGEVDRRYLIWPESAPAVHAGFLAGIAAVAGAGNLVATAAAGHPQSAFVAAAAAPGVRLVSIGLHCPLEVLLERELGREGRWGGLAASSVGAHDGWTYDLELDSSSRGPEELARLALAIL